MTLHQRSCRRKHWRSGTGFSPELYRTKESNFFAISNASVFSEGSSFSDRSEVAVMGAALPPTVAANSATGCENPKQSRRKAPQNQSRRFFSSAIWLYGGCAWETFGSTGCLDCRFLTPRTAVTQAREKARGSSSNQGR